MYDYSVGKIVRFKGHKAGKIIDDVGEIIDVNTSSIGNIFYTIESLVDHLTYQRSYMQFEKIPNTEALLMVLEKGA